MLITFVLACICICDLSIQLSFVLASMHFPNTVLTTGPISEQTLAIKQPDQTPQVTDAESVNHIPTGPFPYEIPALSLASFRNKGLHLHHDAKGRGAIRTPLQQPQRKYIVGSL